MSPLQLYLVTTLHLTGSVLSWAAKAPIFKSIPTTVKTTEHDTVLLPCFVDNFGESTVRWWKGDRLILDTAKAREEPPSNVRVFKNNTLEVSDVSSADTGEYVCQVIRPPPWGPIDQHHAIQVLYPPALRMTPASGMMEVRLKDEVTISCLPSGVPSPIITWTFNGEEIQLLNNRNTLSFAASKPSMAGEYSCTATNGVGDPASATIILKIVFPPEANADKNWVHTSPGLRIELSCEIMGSPQAKIEWFLNNKPITMGPRLISQRNGDIYSLIFKSTRVSDFGFYTCRGTNNLGVGEKVIQLSGIANTAVFKKGHKQQSEDNYTLIWQVDSYSPIIEYKLLFRQYFETKNQANWTELIVPADIYSPGPIYTQVYALGGLDKATIYEATVASRNRFGWSRPSPVYRFATAGADIENIETTEASTESNLSNTINYLHPVDYSAESEAQSMNSSFQHSLTLSLLMYVLIVTLML